MKTLNQEILLTVVSHDREGQRPIPFVVRIVKKGDAYGRDFCLTHDEDADLIEFYDGRYNFDSFGQFVSRYYVDTLRGNGKYSLGRKENKHTGLNLDGGVKDWYIDGNAMALVHAWLDHLSYEFNGMRV